MRCPAAPPADAIAGAAAATAAVRGVCIACEGAAAPAAGACSAAGGCVRATAAAAPPGGWLQDPAVLSLQARCDVFMSARMAYFTKRAVPQRMHGSVVRCCVNKHLLHAGRYRCIQPRTRAGTNVCDHTQCKQFSSPPWTAETLATAITVSYPAGAGVGVCLHASGTKRWLM
jgi:hypothetical protein